MKRLVFVCLAAALICAPSCKNNSKNAKVEENKDSLALENKMQIADELVKADFQNIIESASKLKPAPFASAAQDGRIVLSNKEKKVKPNYLLNPDLAANLVSFSQKYRAVAMYGADLVIANMYEMDAQPYKDVVAKLLTELGDEAFTNFASMPWIDWENASDAMKILVEAEYEAGRQNFYWESVASSYVEQLYIISRNVDKFMLMFNDETAADFTFNFVCLFESLRQVIELNPEMSSLYEAIKPLEVINAISVKQFKEQIISISDDIAASREALLK